MADTDVTARFRADISDMKSKMDQINRSLGGMQKSTKKAQGGFTILKGAIGTAFGGAIIGGVFAAGKAIGNFASGAIDAASTMEELQSKVNAIFGPEAGAEIAAWSETASKAFGQSQIQAQNAASTFAIFGKGAGLAGSDLVDFSTGLTELSSDLASFYDASPEEAITAIGAALRGETEPIRRFGVMLDAASMQQKAFEMGIISSTKEALLPQQKALAAQALIMEQTADAQGDFARTSDGLANSQRTLEATLEDVKTQVGTGLLPAITEIVQAVGPMLQELAGPLGDVAQQIGGVLADAFEQLAPILPVVAETFGQIATTIGGALANVLKTLIPSLQPVLEAFSELASRLAPLVSKVLGKVAEILGRVLDAVTPLLEPLTDLVMGILDAAWPIVEVVADALLLLVDALTPVLDAVMALLKPLGDLVKVALAAILPVIKPLLPVIETLAALFADVLVRAIGLLMTSIGYMIQAWSQLAPFIINKVLIPILDRFLGWAEDIVAGAETAFSWVPGLGDKLGDARSAIETFRDQSATAMASVAETAATEGKAIGENLVDQGVLAMTNPSALSEAESAGQDVGDSMSEGMRIGIQNGQIPVAAAAARSVALANQAARDAAMARSPSRLFEYLGEDLMAGLEMGIERNTEWTQRLGQDLIDNLASSIQAGEEKIYKVAKETFVGWYTDVKAELQTNLDDAQQLFDDFASGIQSSLMQGISLSGAYEAQFSDTGAQTGVSLLQGFRDQVRQAEWAGSVYQTVRNQALAGGATREAADALAQALAAEGPAIGGAIGQQILDQGIAATMASEYQSVIDATRLVGEALMPEHLLIGRNNAQAEYDAWVERMGPGGDLRQQFLTDWRAVGVDTSQADYEGMRDALKKGGPVGDAIMNLFDRLGSRSATATGSKFGSMVKGSVGDQMRNDMEALARSLDREAYITIYTRYEGGGGTGSSYGGRGDTGVGTTTTGYTWRALGGPVAARTPYIVGERGPELFVPSMAGQIISNADMLNMRHNAPTIDRNESSKSKAATQINLTVNAGMGADGAEIGRQIVESIRKYERRSGPVFASA